MNLKLLFFLFIVQTTFCQEINKRSLDVFLENLGTQNKLMGGVAILKNQRLNYSKSVGYAAIENGSLNSDTTKYRIGSITKTFTATLTLMAVDEGLIALEQPIGAFFPSLQNAQKIQIQHLLSHRSGIHNFTDNPDFINWYQQPKSKAEMLEIVTKGGIDFEPDSQSSYSNSNYVLLTFITQKSSAISG